MSKKGCSYPQRVLVLLCFVATTIHGWGQGTKPFVLASMNAQNFKQFTARSNFSSSTTDFFRSRATAGNWNAAADWESSPDGNTWEEATLVPDEQSAGIIIRAGHTITIGSSAGIVADQLLIEAGGTLLLADAGFTLHDGAGTDLQVDGTFRQTNSAGTFTQNAGSTIAFSATGVYEHARNGGVIPAADWNALSNCYITGIINNSPILTGFGQNFGNLEWNCPGQTTRFQNNEPGFGTQGTLTVAATGSSQFNVHNQIYLSLWYSETAPAHFRCGNIVVKGKSSLIFNDQIDVESSTETSYATFLTIPGNLTIQDSSIIILSSGNAATATGAQFKAVVNLEGNLTLTKSASIGCISAYYSIILFTKNGTQHINYETPLAANPSPRLNYAVAPWSTLVLDNNLRLFSKQGIFSPTTSMSVAGILDCQSYIIGDEGQNNEPGYFARFFVAGNTNLVPNNQKTLIVSTVSGSEVATATDEPSNFTYIGMEVSGPGIPAGTLVTGTLPNKKFSMSNRATATASNVTLNFSSNGALITAHPQGLVSYPTLSGCIQTKGFRTYATTARYVFNGTSQQVNSFVTYPDGNIIENLVYSGNGTQTFTASGAQVSNFLVQKTGGSLTLGSDVNISNAVNFDYNGHSANAGGIITTGAHKIVLGQGASILNAGVKGWVAGNLQKPVTTGGNISRTFEVGSAASYLPATIHFSNVTTPGNLVVGVAQSVGDHPAIATSGIAVDKTVNRYWTLTNSGTAFNNYSATFNYVPGDVDAGANTGNFIVKRYDGTNWSGATAGTRTATSTQASGFTGFNDFAVGEADPVVSDYVSNGNVNLTAPSNWQYNNGIELVNASAAPSGTNNITIQNGDSLTVDASLVVGSGKTLSVSTGKVGIQPNAVLSSTAGTINFNGQPVTIKSSLAGTGSIGQLAADGSNLTGASNVTVERYLGSVGHRAYRQLSSTVIPLASILQNWQEGQNNTSTTANSNTMPGYGMHITGSSSGARGFDATQTGNASMFILNANTVSWEAIANTNVLKLNPKNGYLVFIRGNRGVDLNSTTSSGITTLRATGSLLLGNQVYNVPSGNRYNFITNPFASSIDWTKIYAANGGSAAFNVNNYVYYDPRLNTRGGYVTVQLNGSNNIGDPEAEAIHIQSGQAFWVQPKTGTTSITIHEADKSALNNRNVFRQNNGEIEKLQIGLYFTTASTGRRIADGIAVKFGNDYSKEIGPEDATKFTNFDEDIAILRNGTRLSIEGRPLIADADTLPLYMAKMKQQAYEWQFDASQFNVPGLQAWLQDKFLNTETQISLSEQTIVPFTVTSNSASSAADRFRIVFRTVQVLPINFTTVKAFEKGTAVQVEWNLGNEAGVQGYEVEKSANGRTFGKLGSVQVRSAQSRLNYAFVDPSPSSGNNYYRIRAIEQNGEFRYSQVVNVKTGRTGGEVTIYPNPVKGGIINLQLTNQPAGKYQWQLTNAAGQTLYRGNLTHQGGSLAEQLQVPGKLAAGVYQLQVSSNGTSIVRQVVAE